MFLTDLEDCVCQRFGGRLSWIGAKILAKLYSIYDLSLVQDTDMCPWKYLVHFHHNICLNSWPKTRPPIKNPIKWHLIILSEKMLVFYIMLLVFEPQMLCLCSENIDSSSESPFWAPYPWPRVQCSYSGNRLHINVSYVTGRGEWRGM